MQLNKIHSVRTIALVAAELGEDEDWLYEIGADMESEDGVIWVYDLDDRQVTAFTDFGVETLVDLIAERRRSSR